MEGRPKEQRAVYMNLLASCDVDGMKNFIWADVQGWRKKGYEKI